MGNEGGNNTSRAKYTVMDVIRAEHSDPYSIPRETLERYSKQWKVPIGE
jgi:hypothetical protein